MLSRGNVFGVKVVESNNRDDEELEISKVCILLDGCNIMMNGVLDGGL